MRRSSEVLLTSQSLDAPEWRAEEKYVIETLGNFHFKYRSSGSLSSARTVRIYANP